MDADSDPDSILVTDTRVVGSVTGSVQWNTCIISGGYKLWWFCGDLVLM